MSVMQVYKLKWAMNDKTQAIELIVEMQGEQNRNERRKQFKQKLIDIVKGHHQEFLKGMSREEAAMVSKECWHPKFQVHQVPNIPLAQLPEREEKSGKHYQSVQEFIKANEIKNTKVKEILEASARDNNKENCGNQEGMKQQRSLGLSDTLIAKIKEKERLLNEQKKLQLQSSSKGMFQSDKERLKNVASIIKTYATMRKVSNIFFVQVIDHIVQANKQYLLAKDSICQIIEKLINICPYWLQLINHSQGKILRIEKTDISQILQEIEQYK
eukprot:TRINITY_DN8826_c0_g1_i6.p1 TRINITY_DN8826_c0_g1~~TRINITY_DN8826_c0_g1_i6.p1  ORF type:complete len:271 (-),score=46.64 TRINITY_DN8826_c0_g1_i6:37-849(-)